MKTIRLNKTKVALVDDDDFDLVSSYKWSYNKLGYAMANGKMVNYRFPDGKTFLMHRVILDAKKGQEVDHKNGNKLDNRKENIRLCTREENSWNKPKTKVNASSKYKGVCYSKRDKGWYMQIVAKGKKYSGFFKQEIDAAKEYDKMAKALHGEFAYQNTYINNS